MTKSYEFQGKSVEAAFNKAIEALQIPAEKIRYEVLTHGSSGIFGIVGVKKAKIKVYLEQEMESNSRFKRNEAGPAVSGAHEGRVKDHSAEDKRKRKNDPASFADGVQTLQTIVDCITDGATVRLGQGTDKLIFTISGGERGVLIGKRGQTLESIQYLFEKMINKKSTRRIKVVVDVEGYLEKRKKNLQALASRMAEKVRRIDKPVTIGQMNAHDRRVVHIHLKGEKDVRTQSIGDGYYRKLMIFPKKQGDSKSIKTDLGG
jgi:spoIIIJ-associated protein